MIIVVLFALVSAGVATKPQSMLGSRVALAMLSFAVVALLFLIGIS